MADLKFTALADLPVPDPADLLPIIDIAPTPTSKKITVANLLALASGSDNLLGGLPATDLTATGLQTSSYAAGASIAVGAVVYLGSASKWLPANASAVATSNGMIGISLEAKTDTQPMKVVLVGFFRNDGWNWTPGTPIYLGASAGALTTTPPTGTDSVTRVVGWATTADVIWFAPSPDYLTHV